MPMKTKNLSFFLFSLISALFFFLSIILYTNDIFIHLACVIYLLIYVLSILRISQIPKLTFGMSLFIILFSIGHVIKTGYIFFNIDEAKTLSYFTVNQFDFSYLSISILFFIQSLVLTAAYLCIKFFSKFKFDYNYELFTSGKSKQIILFLIWTLLSVLIILFLEKYGYGKHGLKNSENLPNILGGFLVYFRDLSIPILGLIFLQWNFSLFPKIKWIFIIIYLSIITMIAIYGLSRASFIISIIPLFLLFFRKNNTLLNQTKILIIFTFVFFVVFSLMKIYRSQYFYEFDSLNYNFLSFNMFLSFFETIIKRIEGSSELMAVISSDANNFTNFLNYFFNLMPGNELAQNVFGFNFQVPGKSFGLSFGLAGMLFLSGSFLIVFIGTIFFFSIVFFFEIFFLKRNYIFASVFITLKLMLIIWSNMSMFFIIRYLFIIFFTVLLITIIRFIFKIRIKTR